MYVNVGRYPSNWRKVSLTIRRIAGWRCERCGSRQQLTVHHLGIPYVNGRYGGKHDLRRENLQCLCATCHDEIEPRRKFHQGMASKREKKRDRHRKLGVGTGLVVIGLSVRF